jgi:hypothetical protein
MAFGWVTLDPYFHAITILSAACFLSGVAWPTLRLAPRARAAILIVLGSAIFALPVLVRLPELVPRAIATLVTPLFAAALLDLHVGAASWRRQGFGTWLRFLLVAVILVHRRYAAEPPRPARESARWLLRGLVQIAMGLALLVWAHRTQLGTLSVWLDHLVVAVAAYLVAFDGLFVFMTGALRLLGLHVIDQSRHPILARTPADFWRRYNREAGMYLYENVFKPVGGLRSPVRGIAVVFLINGLYHEYLFTAMTGAWCGYLLLFFAVHAVAVAATSRWRPRGAVAVLSAIGTQLFLLVTSALFFAAADRIFPVYSS